MMDMRALYKRKPVLGLCLAALCLMTACKDAVEVPATFDTLQQKAAIFPDYEDVVVPPNIAPLNFMLNDSAAKACVVCLKGEGEPVVAGGEDCKVMIDTLQWRALLQANKGKDIQVSVYARHEGGWVKYQDHRLHVAPEDIDRYLSYRLIEPGYELYRQLGLYQRDLSGWDVHTIYENNRTYDEKNNHCINCHNYQNYSTQHMLFHVRANHGGTIMVDGAEAHKVQIKDSTILTAGVYPSWHPTLNMVAFSTNRTGQTFHLYHREKIEVMDEASDLLLYDVDKNEVRHILRSRDDMETFPCWAPDGRMLYYCQFHTQGLIDLNTVPDSLVAREIAIRYNQVRYNLMRVSFDPKTLAFGAPEKVLDAASVGKSVSVPRVSPDGRYVLYTLADYGQFHIWHKSSDLWVKDLQADTCYALSAANSKDVDSYHTWSSNGRWIVFSSRRDDGNYTRPYIAYFDNRGQAHKAFMLPHEDPEESILLLKSYNVPELTRDKVGVTRNALRECIYASDGEKARYVR